jgi:hypothetical protein
MAIRALSICSLVTAACAGVLPAQNVLVLPESHRTMEGSGTTNVPFGRSTAVRVQMAYDSQLFNTAGNVTQIAFRLDGGATAVNKQIDVEIRMSTMPLSLVNLSGDFATNRGPDETVVLPRQMLTLPAQNTAASPNPFLAPIVLPTPFPYDPLRGGLLVEVTVFGQPPGAYPLDTTYVCNSPETAVGPGGCPQPGGLLLAVTSATTQVIWGRPWVVQVQGAQAGALTTLILGTMDSGPWNGFNLPFDLAPLGAPGCPLSIDAAGAFFQTAMPDGSAAFTFLIPNSPVALGAWLRFQAGAVNLQANALGFVTSQAKKVQVCGWEPVGRLWSVDLAATAGTREIGVAPVLQLTLQ